MVGERSYTQNSNSFGLGNQNSSYSVAINAARLGCWGTRNGYQNSVPPATSTAIALHAEGQLVASNTPLTFFLCSAHEWSQWCGREEGAHGLGGANCTHDREKSRAVSMESSTATRRVMLKQSGKGDGDRPIRKLLTDDSVPSPHIWRPRSAPHLLLTLLQIWWGYPE